MARNQKSAFVNFILAGFLTLILIPFLGSSATAQNKIKEWNFVQMLTSEEHSAKKATLFSAVIPGWGQAYNKKYWKVPIVWAGLGAAGYFIYTNNAGYKQYKDIYVALSEVPDTTISAVLNGRSVDWTESGLGQVLTNINSFRKNRDLSVVVMFAWWGLNVIDANVDGHFFNFDIDEDLSLQLSPKTWNLAGNKPAMGINLTLKFY